MGDMADYQMDFWFDDNCNPYSYDYAEFEEEGTMFPDNYKPNGEGPCPLCNGPTVKKINNKTQKPFYGCTKFPKCTGNRNY